MKTICRHFSCPWLGLWPSLCHQRDSVQLLLDRTCRRPEMGSDDWLWRGAYCAILLEWLAACRLATLGDTNSGYFSLVVDDFSSEKSCNPVPLSGVLGGCRCCCSCSYQRIWIATRPFILFARTTRINSRKPRRRRGCDVCRRALLVSYSCWR